MKEITTISNKVRIEKNNDGSTIESNRVRIIVVLVVTKEGARKYRNDRTQHFIP
jgi:hypothetical protein